MKLIKTMTKEELLNEIKALQAAVKANERVASGKQQ